MANQPNQSNQPKPAKPSGIRRLFKPIIRSASREPTAGGVTWRRNRQGQVEFLMIQDSKGRWTLPKGHIEPNEKPEEAAIREVREETGLKDLRITGWLGKINFRYRRRDVLVIMSTDIYLIEAMGQNDRIKKEHWMNSIGWFSLKETLDIIEYEDMYKLILLAQKKIRHAAGQ